MKKITELKRIAGHKRFTILSSEMPITISSDGRTCVELPYGQYRFDGAAELFAASDGELKIAYMDTDAEEFVTYSYQKFKGMGVWHGMRERYYVRHINETAKTNEERGPIVQEIGAALYAQLELKKYRDTINKIVAKSGVVGDVKAFVSRYALYRATGQLRLYANAGDYNADVYTVASQKVESILINRNDYGIAFSVNMDNGEKYSVDENVDGTFSVGNYYGPATVWAKNPGSYALGILFNFDQY